MNNLLTKPLIFMISLMLISSLSHASYLPCGNNCKSVHEKVSVENMCVSELIVKGKRLGSLINCYDKNADMLCSVDSIICPNVCNSSSSSHHNKSCNYIVTNNTRELEDLDGNCKCDALDCQGLSCFNYYPYLFCTTRNNTYTKTNNTFERYIAPNGVTMMYVESPLLLFGPVIGDTDNNGECGQEDCICKPNGLPGGFLGGPKGDVGPKGDAGPKGDIGPKGDVGETGPKGDVGETGPKGPKGEEGDKGPKGEEGPRGPKGPKGKCESNDNLSWQTNSEFILKSNFENDDIKDYKNVCVSSKSFLKNKKCIDKDSYSYYKHGSQYVILLDIDSSYITDGTVKFTDLTGDGYCDGEDSRGIACYNTNSLLPLVCVLKKCKNDKDIYKIGTQSYACPKFAKKLGLSATDLNSDGVCNYLDCIQPIHDNTTCKSCYVTPPPSYTSPCYCPSSACNNISNFLPSLNHGKPHDNDDDDEDDKNKLKICANDKTVYWNNLANSQLYTCSNRGWISVDTKILFGGKNGNNAHCAPQDSSMLNVYDYTCNYNGECSLNTPTSGSTSLPGLSLYYTLEDFFELEKCSFSFGIDSNNYDSTLEFIIENNLNIQSNTFNLDALQNVSVIKFNTNKFSLTNNNFYTNIKNAAIIYSSLQESSKVLCPGLLNIGFANYLTNPLVLTPIKYWSVKCTGHKIVCTNFKGKPINNCSLKNH